MDLASVMVASRIIRSTAARVNRADSMSCSSGSLSGAPWVSSVATKTQHR